jgi:TonB family protein
MTRLQKKCLIAVAGTHLLVVVTLLCSGFITSKPKPDDTQLLTMIPANLIDAAFNSGVKGAVPPPPAPMVKPPEPVPQVQPPPPVVRQVEPVKQPDPEPVKPPDKIKPDDLQPVEKPEKPQPKKIEVNLKPVVRNKTKEPDTSAADAAKEKRLRDARQKAFQSAARNLKNNFTTGTTVDMPPGNSSVAYANYASVVKSVYTQTWVPPDDAANDDANVKVSVTIANDGTVISAHIVTPSSDKSVDNSVQKTLDRVHDIAPFPDGAKEKERTYIINFNLKAKRMLG